MTLSWSSHVHHCTNCGRRQECADPDCDMTTQPWTCGECESEMQYQFYLDRLAEAAARHVPESDDARHAQEF